MMSDYLIFWESMENYKNWKLYGVDKANALRPDRVSMLKVKADVDVEALRPSFVHA